MNDKAYFLHILESIRKIERYTKNVSFVQFHNHEMMVGATIRELAIIGEAAKQMGSVGKKQLPSIPWPDVIAMRNILIHEYFGTDIETIWQTIQEDLPMLKKAIQILLKKK